MYAIVLVSVISVALGAQALTIPDLSPVKPELQLALSSQKTSGKVVVPPEEDGSFLKEEHSFNPLRSQNSVKIGDHYLKKGKYQAAASRYLDATMWNDDNGEAWLKLGNADQKLKDKNAAKAAYAKYLSVAPDAKNATQIRKKLEKMK
jgi:tetratricopeptide (TPR) repeat protein